MYTEKHTHHCWLTCLCGWNWASRRRMVGIGPRGNGYIFCKMPAAKIRICTISKAINVNNIQLNIIEEPTELSLWAETHDMSRLSVCLPVPHVGRPSNDATVEYVGYSCTVWYNQTPSSSHAQAFDLKSARNEEQLQIKLLQYYISCNRNNINC